MPSNPPVRASRTRHPSAILLIAGSLIAIGAPAAAMAQSAPLPSLRKAVQVDSGVVRNDLAADPIGADPRLLFRDEVRIAGAPWVRLVFDALQLAGDPRAGMGSYLVITSLKNGASQRLDAEHAGYWQNSSAFFNGDAVSVELWAYPGTGVNRVSIGEIIAGVESPIDGLCDNDDSRTPLSDPSIARLMTTGISTAFLINHGNSANRFLTAGHSLAVGENGFVQFNVPLSTPGGAAQHPPPEYQYPLQVPSIQSLDGGQGNDAATFQSFPNSNTGLSPRVAQRDAIFPLPNVPNPSNQAVRVTGFGSRVGAAPVPIPWAWDVVSKTHFGPYTLRQGNALGYRVDVSTGNSGGPLVLETGGAIGIVTHIGCAGAQNANVATAVDHPALLQFLALPLGTNMPYTPLSHHILGMPTNSNNQGAAGGAVYFDASVGGLPIDVWGLDLNIRNNATPGGTYSADVYITPGGRAGKETDASRWTRVTTGTGIVNPRDTMSRMVFPHPFRLVQGTTYGMAIVVTGDGAGHAYTNGTFPVSTTGLTITPGAASNSPFSGIIEDRTWNGRLVYDILPDTQQCMETLFDSNNSGSAGGAVYFDLDISEEVPEVRVNALRLNSSAGRNTPLTLTIYRHADTALGHTHSSAGWEVIGTATGLAAGIDLPTMMVLDERMYFEPGSEQGIALVLSGGGHAYTNGTGFNEIYWNTAMRIEERGATNAPFNTVNPAARVWNGSLCYTLGSPACTGVAAASQYPPSPTDGFRNSNTTGQQIADDFQLDAAAQLTTAKLWAVYAGDPSTPATQDFIINIYEHDAVSNGPGAPVYSQMVANIAPVRIGIADDSGREIYEFEVPLPGGFEAAANQRYAQPPRRHDRVRVGVEVPHHRRRAPLAPELGRGMVHVHR